MSSFPILKKIVNMVLCASLFGVATVSCSAEPGSGQGKSDGQGDGQGEGSGNNKQDCGTRIELVDDETLAGDWKIDEFLDEFGLQQIPGGQKNFAQGVPLNVFNGIVPG